VGLRLRPFCFCREWSQCSHWPWGVAARVSGNFAKLPRVNDEGLTCAARQSANGTGRETACGSTIGKSLAPSRSKDRRDYGRADACRKMDWRANLFSIKSPELYRNCCSMLPIGIIQSPRTLIILS
jgi:hypothetical protein